MHLREDISTKDHEMKALSEEIEYLKRRATGLEEDTRDLRMKDTENQVHSKIGSTFIPK